MTNARGVDLSAYQSVTPPLAGLSFLAARASISMATPNGFVTEKDARYDQHIGKAKAAGLVTIAYHFADSRQDIAQQVAAFKAFAGAVDFYFVDVESADGGQLSWAQTHEFITRAQAAIGECGLYMSASIFRWKAGQNYDWIASYGANTGSPGTPPAGAWEFWQYTSKGQLPGYAPRLDLNQYNGTDAQLRAFAGIPPAPPSDVEVSVPLIVGSDRVLGDVAAGTPYFDTPGGTQVGTTGAMHVEWYGSPTLADGVTRDPDWCLIVGLNADLTRPPGAHVARYIKRPALINPRVWPAPAPPDCTAQVAAGVKAATDPLNAQITTLNTQVQTLQSRISEKDGLARQIPQV